MKDMKKDKDLIGPENWPKIPIVVVEGVKGAKEYKSGMLMEEGRKVLVSWKDIAILKVSTEIPFYLGFMIGTHCQFLRFDTETKDGMFGMRVGPEDVTFFVFPKDLKTEMKLDLVEMTDIDNSKYKDLPLY
jgi:hypothetical protein